MALVFADLCSYTVESAEPQYIIYLLIGSLYFSAKLNENTAICFQAFQSQTHACPHFKALLTAFGVTPGDFQWAAGWYLMLENLIFSTLAFKPLLITPAEVAATIYFSVDAATIDRLQNFDQVLCSAIKATYTCLEGKSKTPREA